MNKYFYTDTLTDVVHTNIKDLFISLFEKVRSYQNDLTEKQMLSTFQRVKVNHTYWPSGDYDCHFEFQLIGASELEMIIFVYRLEKCIQSKVFLNTSFDNQRFHAKCLDEKIFINDMYEYITKKINQTLVKDEPVEVILDLMIDDKEDDIELD